MTASTFPRSGNPRKPIPAAEAPRPAGQIPEGVGFAAGTAAPTSIERAPRPPIVTRAESAPCTCPEHCERDHEND
jgi:hypothetical protein